MRTGKLAGAAPLLLGLSASFGSPAPPARAADCAAPGWVKSVQLRPVPGELVATGEGPTPAVAEREARRALSLKLVKRHGWTCGLALTECRRAARGAAAGGL